MYTQVIHKILTIQWCNSDRIQPDASVESSQDYKRDTPCKAIAQGELLNVQKKFCSTIVHEKVKKNCSYDLDHKSS